MKNSSVRSACGAQISQDHQEGLITWGVLISHLPSGAIFTPGFPGIQFIFLGNHLWKVSLHVVGRWNDMSLKLPPKPNPSGMILPLPHFVTVSSITSLTIICSDKRTLQLKSLPWTQSCLASFNLCHLPERQSNECTQKSLHKIIQQEP